MVLFLVVVLGAGLKNLSDRKILWSEVLEVRSINPTKECVLAVLKISGGGALGETGIDNIYGSEIAVTPKIIASQTTTIDPSGSIIISISLKNDNVDDAMKSALKSKASNYAKTLTEQCNK